MEKQLLYLLDYDLRFDEAEACRYFAPFMTADVSLSTRSSAVNRVAKAGKARAEAQQLTQPALPTPGEKVSKEKELKPEVEELRVPAQVHLPPTSLLPSSASTGSSTAAALSSAVRGIARKISTAHLRQNNPASHMHSTVSAETTATTSTSTSDLVSLVDDNGSSSSSSGWTSNESDADDDPCNVGIVEPTSSTSNLGRTIPPVVALLAGPGTMKKPFSLRPLPHVHKACAATTIGSSSSKADTTPTRSRKPSDAYSVHTVTASPSYSRKPHTGAFSRAADTADAIGKRSHSLSVKISSSAIPPQRRDHLRMPPSATMPSLSTHASAAYPANSMHLRPCPFMNASSSSSASSCSASSSQAMLAQPSCPPPAPPSKASTPRGVGAIISRMWGAAAANLKVGGGSTINTAQGQDLSESRPLMASVDATMA